MKKETLSLELEKFYTGASNEMLQDKNDTANLLYNNIQYRTAN